MMLTSEDHRQIAERCIRLATTCTELRVAEQLLTFAANHLEKAELALRSPASVLRRHIRLMQLQWSTTLTSLHEAPASISNTPLTRLDDTSDAGRRFYDVASKQPRR
jgi:hypothetical protein